jgi:hypothetical protein
LPPRNRQAPQKQTFSFHLLIGSGSCARHEF